MNHLNYWSACITICGALRVKVGCILCGGRLPTLPSGAEISYLYKIVINSFSVGLHRLYINLTGNIRP